RARFASENTRSPPAGTVAARLFWQTTVVWSTDAEAVAHVWSADAYVDGPGDSRTDYTFISSTAYRLLRVEGDLRIAHSYHLESSMVRMTAEQRRRALEAQHAYLAKWLEARLMRNTIVLREVAAGAELERLESFVVQAPTNT